MKWVLGASVCLQLYFMLTCGIVWALSSENGHLLSHHRLDENLLDVLVIAKVIAAPVSLVLLAVNFEWGKKFIGCMFLVYGLGSYAMPFLAGTTHPKAWWSTVHAAGEGPVIALVFIALGTALAFPRQLARFNQWMSNISPPADGSSK